MTSMTDANALRRLLGEATANGEWLWRDNGVVTAGDKIVLCLDMSWARIPDGENFEYLRAGMQALPALLDEIEAEPVVCDGCGGTWTDGALDRLRAEKPEVRSCCPERKPILATVWRSRAQAAEARVAELSSLVSELADELESELQARYAGMLPQLENRFERDMDPVRRARATEQAS